MTDRVCVGAIAGAFGVRGEVRLKSFCTEPRDIGRYGPLSSEDGTQSFAVTALRAVKNGFAARIDGVATKEQADALRGERLYAPRAALPRLSDDEFYHADLIGMEAVDVGGARLGRVAAVHNFGAGDILELRAPTKAAQLIPFDRLTVPTVDLEARRVIVDLPDEADP